MKDFIQEVKLLSKDSGDLALPSTSSGTYTKPSTQSHMRRSLKSAKQPLHDNHENSIDADDSLDLELALNFPKELEKYTDDIWRKTLSDCDPSIHTPWEKQPEVNKTPSIVWPSSSSADEMYNPMRSQFFPDFWTTGGNIFFPTPNAGASTSSSTSAAVRNSSDLRNQRKVPIGGKSTANSADEDDFSNIKKRLSLSSLRSSLCRQQKGGNESVNIARTSTSDDDDDDVDLLQVLIIISIFYFRRVACYLCSVFTSFCCC